MSNYPKDYKYTKDHEWLAVQGNQIKLGVSEFAQSELGELVFVELPEIGTEFSAGNSVCIVESTKAASDVYTPISGKVVAVNEKLNDAPDLINSDPHNEGWMVVIENAEVENELEKLELMNSEQYEQFVS